MRKLFLACISLLTALPAHAQIFDWALSTTGTNYTTYAISSTHVGGGQTVVGGHLLGATSSDFDPDAPVFTLSAQGSGDVFVASYDNNADFLWAFSIGASGGHVLLDDIASDAAGNVYISGGLNNVNNVDFDPGPGTALLSTFGTAIDIIYLASYDNQGNYRWAFTLGSANTGGRGSALTVTPFAEVVMAGHFIGGASPFDFEPGSGTVPLQGHYGRKAFTAWYSTNGTCLRAQTHEGFAETVVRDVHADLNGNVYITGELATFNSTADFDPGPGIDSISLAYGSAVFLTQYSINGTFTHLHKMHINGYGVGKCVYTDPNGNFYWALNYYGTIADADPGAGTVSYVSSSGQFATLLIRFDAAAVYQWSFQVEATTCSSLAVDVYSHVYMVGSVTVSSTVPDYDPGPGTMNATANGIYLSRYTGNGQFFSVFEMSNNSPGGSSGQHLDITSTGELYFSGWYNQLLDFDPSPSSTTTLPVSGTMNMFLVRYVTHPNGIADPQQQQLSIYPNPATNSFMFESAEQGTLELTNALGEVLKTIRVFPGRNEIGISELADGVYSGVLSGESGSRSNFRLVKY